MHTRVVVSVALALAVGSADAAWCRAKDGLWYPFSAPECGGKGPAVAGSKAPPDSEPKSAAERLLDASEKAAADQRRRLESYGTPKSVYYGSGGYESRTYHIGDSILTVQLRNGVIIDESVFVSRK